MADRCREGSIPSPANSLAMDNYNKEEYTMKNNNEMVQAMMSGFDLTDIGTWMIEAVPSTMTEMQELVGMDMDTNNCEKQDTELQEFNDAMWEAVASANSEVVGRKMRLLEILKEHTIKNAREIAVSIDKNGDEDGIYDKLMQAIVRCEDGNGTDSDWDLLVEQTEM